MEENHARAGGVTITKKTKMENQSLCSNPECARVFTNPIVVQDLSSKNKASYYACPHCLTKIATEKGLGVKEKKQTQKTKSARLKQTIARLKEVPPPQPLEIHKCPHHFGYLSQHSKNENIPEECMTCEKLLQCMYV